MTKPEIKILSDKMNKDTPSFPKNLLNRKVHHSYG